MTTYWAPSPSQEERTRTWQPSARRKLQNFIDGESVDSADGATEEVTNPANGEVIADMPLSTEEDVNRAVAAAKARVRRLVHDDAGRARDARC